MDVGFTENEFSVTENYLEKHYPYQNKITALGIVKAPLFKQRYPQVRIVTYDGREFPF